MLKQKNIFLILVLIKKISNNEISFIQSEKLSKVWFKQDDQFKLPKACVVFELFSPIANVDPQSANKVYMFAGTVSKNTISNLPFFTAFHSSCSFVVFLIYQLLGH